MNSKPFSSNKYQKWLLPQIEDLFNRFFLLNQRKAKFRLIAILLSFFLAWIILTLYFQPFLMPSAIGYSLKFLPITNDPVLISIDQILVAFLSIDVIRRLFIIFAAFYLAYCFTSRYILIFHELRDPKMSRQYLIRSVFGILDQPIIKIENGQVENQNKQSGFFRIGGPAKVRVGLENVAVFERPEGMVEIVGPTINLAKSAYQLSGFEKLREIIDLRNQTLNINLQARTKDGIRISIKEIRLIFSIARGSSKITLTRPYPFRTQAIYWLVYHLPTGGWIDAVEEQASQFIIDFIREKTIDETLSLQIESKVGRQFKTQTIRQNQKWREKRHIRRYHQPHFVLMPKKRILNTTSRRLVKKVHPPIYQQLSQTPYNIISSKHQKTTSSKFTYDTLNKFLINKFQNYGLKIDWNNKGYWETPIQDISKSDLETALSVEDQLTRDMQSIDNIHHQYRINELARLIQTLVNVDKNTIFFTTSLDSRNYLLNLTNLLKNYRRFGKDIPDLLKFNINRSIDLIEKQIE